MKNTFTFKYFLIPLLIISSIFISLQAKAEETSLDVSGENTFIQTARFIQDIHTIWHAGRPWPVISKSYQYRTADQIFKYKEPC
jgi:hypothetical protein